MANVSDHVIRAMTDDGAFRVLAARTTDTVRGIVAAQEVRGESAVYVGDVVTAAVLVRETMAPGNRVQVLYTDRIGSRLVGDAQPEGNTRGLAQIVDDVLGLRAGEGGVLQVVRVVRPGRSHQGFVETGDEDTVASAIRSYFLQSEQVQSMVAIATAVDTDGEVVAAGGFVVQLLPELTEPPLVRMKAKIDALGPLAARIERLDADPARVVAELLEDVEHTILADSPVRFRCSCGRERAVAAAATLGADEVRELLESGEELSISCDFCRTRYTVGTADYRRILDAGEGRAPDAAD